MIPRPSRPAKPGCVVCGRIRMFVVLAAFILAMMWAQPEWQLPSGLDYSSYVGHLFLVGFIALFAWKYYQYRKGPQDEAEVEPPPVRRVRRNRVPGDPRR